MNYKVKVESEAESKEVQELFFELGYRLLDGCSLNDVDVDWLFASDNGFIFVKSFRCNEYKELTIPQLKDMVVLKRNDKSDANYKSDSLCKYLGYLTSNGVEYFWNYLNRVWHLSESTFKSVGLKPIEKKEITINELRESMKDSEQKIVAMKEFLVNHNNKWTLQLLDSGTEENSYRVAVPSGMNIYWKEDGNYWFTTRVMGYRGAEIIWQRSETEYLMQGENGDKLMESVAELKGQESVKVEIDELKHRVYKKDVSHLDSIDVYRVLELFNVQSHAVGHAIKKLLCSGGRGAKDEAQDIQEAIDSLIRYQEMKNEDK